MAFYDNPEDEEKLLIAGGKDPNESPDYADILSKYDILREEGDKSYSKAEKKTNAKNAILNVGDGLSGAMGGWAEAVSGGKVKASNDNFFKEGIDQNNSKLAGIKADTKFKLNDLLKKDDLARTNVERGQKDKEVAYKENQRDPSSPRAVAARAILSKQMKLSPEELKNLSYEDMMSMAKVGPDDYQRQRLEIDRKKLEQGDQRIGQGQSRLDLQGKREDRMLDQYGDRRVQKFQDDATGATKMMRQTDTWKSSEKVLSEIPTIKNLIKDAKTKGGQSLSMLGPVVAKAIAGEVGVLTDKDVTRYVQSPALIASIMDSAEKMKSGRLSEISAENLERLVDISEKEARRKREQAITREAVLFSRREGVPLADAKYLLDEAFTRPEVETRPAAVQAAAPAAIDTTPPPASGTVKIKAPDGLIREVKKEVAQKYIDKGGVIVP